MARVTEERWSRYYVSQMFFSESTNVCFFFPCRLTDRNGKVSSLIYLLL